MKKVLSSLLLLLSFLFLSCGNLFGPKENLVTDDSNLVLRFSNGGTGSARTITCYDLGSVSSLDWTIKFYTETEDGDGNKVRTEVTPSKKTEDKTSNKYSYKLLHGTYIVTAEATVVDASDSYPVYGETSVTIGEEAVNATIYVGLKKSEDGKGSISTVSVNINPNILVKGNNYTFTTQLISQADSTKKVALSNTYAFSTGDLSLEGENIPSGYYYLNITYKVDDSDVVYNLYAEDMLVEIVDGQTISCTIKAINNYTNRTYFATTEDSLGKGYTSDTPINFDELWGKLGSDHSWTSATVYMGQVPTLDGNNLNFNLTDEFDNVIKRTVTLVITDSDYNGEYEICEKKVNIIEGAVALIIVGGGVTPVEITGADKLGMLSLQEGACASMVDVVLEGTTYVYLEILEEDVPTYSETNPFVQLVYGEDNPVDAKLNFECSVDKYKINTFVEDDVVYYYFVQANTGSISVINPIPEFILELYSGDEPLSGTVDFTSDNITAKILCLRELEEIDPNALVKWYINGVEVTDASGYGVVNFTFNPATIGVYVLPRGTNIVKCVVEFNGTFANYSSSFETKVTPYLTTNEYANSYSKTVTYTNAIITESGSYDCPDIYALGDNNSLYTFEEGKLSVGDGIVMDNSNFQLYNFEDSSQYDSMAFDTVTKYLYLTRSDYVSGYLEVLDTAYTPDTATNVVSVALPEILGTISCFAVYNGVICGVNTSNEAFVIDTSIESEDGVITALNIDNFEQISDHDPDNPVTNLLSLYEIETESNVKNIFTQFYMTGDYAYFLFKTRIVNTMYSSSKLDSRGFIGRIKIFEEGERLEQAEIDVSYIFGWTPSESEEIDHICYTPDGSSDTFTGFFGPTRISAIKKADEIVVQDFGFYKSEIDDYIHRIGYKAGFVTVNLTEKTAEFSKINMEFTNNLSMDSQSNWGL